MKNKIINKIAQGAKELVNDPYLRLVTSCNIFAISVATINIVADIKIDKAMSRLCNSTSRASLQTITYHNNMNSIKILEEMRGKK